MPVNSFPISPASPTRVIQATTSTEYCAGLPDAPLLALYAVGQCRENDLPHTTPNTKFVDQKARRRLIGPHKQVSFFPDIIEEILALPTAAQHHDHSCTDTYIVVDYHHGSLQEDIWYSRAELDMFNKVARTSVLKFHKTNANQVKDFFTVLAESSSSSSSSRQEELQEGRLLVVPKYAQKVLLEVESSVMPGLEAYFHPAIRARRRWHVKSLVAASQKLMSSSTSRDSQ
jgi:hypothetical protein